MTYRKRKKEIGSINSGCICFHVNRKRGIFVARNKEDNLYVDNYLHSCPRCRVLRERQDTFGHRSPVCARRAVAVSNPHTGRGSVGFLQFGSHHDDRPVRGGRRRVPDGACQDDKLADTETGGYKRDEALPLGGAGHGGHRGFREQYGHGGIDVAHRGEPCGERQHVGC